MLRYIIKRLLWFVPTLVAVTIIGFMLLASAPGDPVNSMISVSNSGGGMKSSNDIDVQKNYWRKNLGLDLPLFYFSITKLSEPDTLYKVYDSQVLKKIKEEINESSSYKNFIPKFVWYGFHNQYHRWLFGGQGSKGIISGDFGLSYSQKVPVMEIIKDKIGWSLFFSLLSILVAYAISIPLGIKIAEKPFAKSSNVIQTVLFFIYSIPTFFMGVLLLMVFANPDVISVFPPSGIKPIEGYSDSASFFEKITDSLPYVILPLICYTYSSLAFITRLTTTSINEQLFLDYIKTAKAKGLSDKCIVYKHALKNSLLPLITIFSSLFPGIIGGSVIIESIFTIPGLGLETVKSIVSQDYPFVIAVITLSACITILSYLLADVLNAWIDPRVRKSLNSNHG